MTPDQLDIFLQEGEGTMLEYKESLSASFARELVALANTLGGRILLGVRDDGSVVGINDSNDLRTRIQDIARNCDPPVQVLVEPVGNVMVVTVRESNANPAVRDQVETKSGPSHPGSHPGSSSFKCFEGRNEQTALTESFVAEG